ncbi:MAG: hypothetical protein CVV06_08970 [Gammaproteobacteria bacterium HGW-Gammaproteobacteria-10]|nr:MAG: hypothetical protein CVV06_08970 [Gammaproteobacteria bacterium HGW-Gammaproteobacteria-10]
MNQTDKTWHLQGGYFEACNCETACPCIWLKPPSEGTCKLLVAWHIEKGHYQQVSLDNLNVVLACYSPGTMIEGNWQAALYIDDRADDDQANAITEIFGGRAGGHPQILMSLVSEVLGIEKTPIYYSSEKNQRRLSIPGIAEAEIESIQGISGGESTISNPPLCVVPSHASIVARSKHYRYKDYQYDWTFSERNGFYSDFEYRP